MSTAARQLLQSFGALAEADRREVLLELLRNTPETPYEAKKMRNKTSKFREEEVVRVLPGVRDPDFGTNIGGWSGKVGKVERSDDGSWLYMIRLDQDTLSAAGDDYAEKCEDENLNFEILFLEEKYLESVDDAGSKEDTFLLA
jgi:hypothetical protein